MKKQITQQELVDILSAVDGSKPLFMSLVAEVDVQLKKTNNMYANDKVTKINKYMGIINYSYQNSVNLQRMREDKIADFKAKAAYATKINDAHNGCLSTHDKTGQMYLSFKEQSVNKNPIYKINNQVVGTDTATYLSQFRINRRKAAVHQEVEEQVQHRNVKIENIKVITLNGIEYTIS
jgi:hypothetical protein